MTLDECLNIKCKNPSWLQSICLQCCQICITLYRKHQMDYCQYWRKRMFESDDYEPRAEWMLFVSVHIQTMFLFSYTLDYVSVLKYFCHLQFCGVPARNTTQQQVVGVSVRFNDTRGKVTICAKVSPARTAMDPLRQSRWVYPSFLQPGERRG